MTTSGKNLERNSGLNSRNEVNGMMEQSPSKKTKLMSEMGADVKQK
jgi:hypothetical protein